MISFNGGGGGGGGEHTKLMINRLINMISLLKLLMILALYGQNMLIQILGWMSNLKALFMKLLLFRILGMGAGPSELGKFARKNRNLEQLKPVQKPKILKPGPKTLQTV